MELRHLRYFIAVAEAENVSRAALKLHVSQPALSRQIRDLEGELGFALLQRSAKSVRLTEAGRVLLTEARAVIQRAEEAVKAARAVAAGDAGELHVGYAPSLTARLLPPALRAFQAELPNMRVRLHDLSTNEMLTGVRDGKLQIALVVRPPAAMLRGLRFEALTQDAMRIAVAPRHAFARRREVTVADVVRQPLVAYRRSDYPEYHEFLSELFAGTGVKPVIAEEHDGIASLIAAVESGAGVALVSESVGCIAGPRLKLIPLTPEPASFIIGAALPKGKLAGPAALFLKCAQAAVKSD